MDSRYALVHIPLLIPTLKDNIRRILSLLSILMKRNNRSLLEDKCLHMYLMCSDYKRMLIVFKHRLLVCFHCSTKIFWSEVLITFHFFILLNYFLTSSLLLSIIYWHLHSNCICGERVITLFKIHCNIFLHLCEYPFVMLLILQGVELRFFFNERKHS